MTSGSKLNSSESIALKAISGVGLAIFTALMVVHWNHVLSKVEVAKDSAPAVTPSTTTNAAAAPPVASTSGVAPSATSTSAIATNSTTTPSTPVSSGTAPITTTPTTPTSESTAAAPSSPTVTTTAPITTTSATTTTSTPVETTPAEPSSLAAVESTPATDTMATTTTATSNSADAETLKTQLYNTLDKEWTQYPSFNQDLVYKVTVAGDGSIVNYQPIHQAAIDYFYETPLDGANTNSATSGTDFMVVMTPDGILEVNPWIGK